MQRLSGSSISLLSYIDPASALLFAFAFLHERLTWVQLLGAVLIFGGTLFSQYQKSSSKSKAIQESLTG
jgi:drug/metabolite transporter (DMT)-like permease